MNFGIVVFRSGKNCEVLFEFIQKQCFKISGNSGFFGMFGGAAGFFGIEGTAVGVLAIWAPAGLGKIFSGATGFLETPSGAAGFAGASL